MANAVNRIPDIRLRNCQRATENWKLSQARSKPGQQNQNFNKHDRRHARDGKHQGFLRLVVTSKPFDLHGQCSKLLATVTTEPDS